MGHGLTACFEAIDRELTTEEQDFLRTHCPDAKITNRQLSMRLEDTNLKIPGDVAAMMRRGLDAGYSERDNGDRSYWVRLSQAPPADLEEYNPRKGRRLYDWFPDESGPGGILKVVRLQPPVFYSNEYSDRMESLAGVRQRMQSGDLSLLFMANYANFPENNRRFPVPLALLREKVIGRQLRQLLSLYAPIFEMLNREQRRRREENENWVPDNWRLSNVELKTLELEALQEKGLLASEGRWYYDDEDDDDELPGDGEKDQSEADQSEAEQSDSAESQSDSNIDASENGSSIFCSDPRSTAAKIIILVKAGDRDNLQLALLHLWYLKMQVQGSDSEDLYVRTKERMLETTSDRKLLLQLFRESKFRDDMALD